MVFPEFRLLQDIILKIYLPQISRVDDVKPLRGQSLRKSYLCCLLKYGKASTK